MAQYVKFYPLARRRQYSTALVSKRLTDESAACLRERYCTGGGAEFQKLAFINDRDFQFFSLCQFTSCVLAGDDEIRLFTNRAADPSAASLDVCLSVIALHCRHSPR